MTDYLQYRLSIKNEGKPPKQKKVYKIRQFSKKRQKENLEYAKVSKPLWEGKDCAIKSPGCQGRATGMHHLKGKIGELLTDTRYMLPSCGYCNTIWVEQHHAEAAAKGFKLSRLNKD